VDADVTIRPSRSTMPVRSGSCSLPSINFSARPTSATRLRCIERAWRKKSIVYRPITASGMAVFGLPSEATKWSAHSVLNAPPMTRWNCGACTLILLLGDRVSLGGCSDSRKTNAAVETSHGFSLALLKYSRPRSRYTEMRDTDWFVKRLLRG
jgi:hypothetical protein